MAGGLPLVARRRLAVVVKNQVVVCEVLGGHGVLSDACQLLAPSAVERFVLRLRDERLERLPHLLDRAKNTVLRGVRLEPKCPADLVDRLTLEVAQDERGPLHLAERRHRIGNPTLDLGAEHQPLGGGKAGLGRVGGAELFEVRRVVAGFAMRPGADQID